MTSPIDTEALATARAIADYTSGRGSSIRLVADCLARLVRAAQQIPPATTGPGAAGSDTEPGLPTGESSSAGELGGAVVAGGESPRIVVGSTWKQSVPPGIRVEVLSTVKGVQYQWRGESGYDDVSEKEFRMHFTHVSDPPPDAVKPQENKP